MITDVAKYALQEGVLKEWETFMIRHQTSFQPLQQTGEEEERKLSEGEYSLEYSIIHKEFEDMVERQIGEYLVGLGESMDSFIEIMKLSVEKKEESGETCNYEGKENEEDEETEEDIQLKTQSNVFVELLLGCIDFLCFVDIMKDDKKREYYFSILRMWSKSLK